MRSSPAALFLLVLFQPAAAESPRYFGGSAASGTSAAVRVDNVPLAHTTQLLPADDRDRIAGKAAEQAERLLDNLDTALREVGSRLDRAVKLNVYVTHADTIAEVEKALARRFKGTARPAVSYVVTRLPRSDALVAADAIAISDAKDAARKPNAAVLPAGARVYISGQAEKGKNLAEATRKTLASLDATLKHLGLSRADVVQAKSFLTPMKGVEDARKELVAFFGKSVPPLAFVEWESGLPIEIELVVAAGKDRKGEVIEYLTPPGMTASPVYSRVARINHGPTIFVGGLYGAKRDTPADEVQSAFAALTGILKETGGDLRHLAKATYYHSTDAVSAKLNELRPRYYDPRRPPAASKAKVAGVGRAGTLTMDLIAVPVTGK